MNLKEAREFAGITQKEAEMKLGVPWRSLQNWESGLRRPAEYVEKSLVQRFLQTKLVVRIRVRTESIQIEVPLEDGTWETYYSAPLLMNAGDEPMLPLSCLKLIEILSQSGLKLDWMDE